MAQLVSGKMSPKGWRTKATQPHVMRAVNSGGGMSGGFIDPSIVIDPGLQRRQEREKAREEAAHHRAAAKNLRNRKAKERARARKAAQTA